MKGAADRFALHLLAIFDDVGGHVFRQVRTHMRAIGIDHVGRAAFTPVKDEILSKIMDRAGPRRHLGRLRDHEPAAGVGKFAQPIICCARHHRSPSSVAIR
jgi:hypothetical protein